MSGMRLLQAAVRWPLAIMLAMAAMIISMPQAQAQHTSPTCPVQTATVERGSSVEIDITDCDPYNFGFGSGPPLSRNGPSHGSAILRQDFVPPSTAKSVLIYTHNGNTATSDSLEIEDLDLFWVRINITITPPASAIIVAPTALPTLTAGTPFSQTLTATGGNGAYTYTISSGTLPVGVSLTPSGVLSGTPTQRGGYSFVVRVQDSIGAFVAKAYSGTVQNPNISITPTTATAGQGVPFSQTLTAVGGVAPHSYLLETGALPAGLSISSAGVISGTTNAAPGNFPVTLRVTDASTPSNAAYFELETFTVTVAALPTVSIAVAPASVSEDGASNLVYTVTRSAASASALVVNIATAGTAISDADYTGSAATVTIPANATTASLTIDPVADGLVEANETVILSVAAGAAYIVGAPASATGNILNDDVPTASITLAPASVLEDGAANLVYTVALDAPAAAPITVNYTLGGTATNGNDYNATGSSVVIAAGATSETIIIDPSANGTIESDETVIITLAAGTGYTVGAPASATGTILNDDFPSIFIDSVSVVEGNSGTTNAVFTISLSAPATASGVTFDIATFNFFALAGQDYVANSQSGILIPAGASSATFTVLVNGDALNEPDEGFFVRLANVAGAFVGGSQGIGTITNDDPLPTLSVASLSVVEGNSGTTNLNFQLTLDAPSGQAVSSSIATANGSATAGSDYVAATGSFTFQPGETSKSFPVTVNGDTLPEADESFNVVLSAVSNAITGSGTATGTIVNDDVPLTILPTVLPAGSVGTLYSAILTTDGGAAPYSYAVTAGTLPAGLNFDANGTLSGTPVAAGNASFTITATDSSGAPGPYTASQAYTVAIAAPMIELTPVTLPNATFGVPYSEVVTASGSIAPYSFAITSGSLPPGLTLAPGGTLSGTPTLGGARTFTITASDATGAPGPYAGARAYTLTVDVPALVLPATALPDGATDTAYSAQIGSATGGVAPYSYVVTSGQLPSGLTLSSTGAITGTPMTANLFSFVVTATDSNSGTGPTVVQQSYSINIVNTPPVANPVSATVAYGATLTPIALSITGTANSVAVVTPPTNGRAIVDQRTISYIPDTGFAGSDSFTYIASNNGANSAPALVTISVANPAITVTAAGPLTATVGTAYSETFTFGGGTQPFTNYQVTGLPAGLQLGSSGVNTISIQGTPTSAGSFTLTVSATDASTGAGPFGASQAFTLNIAAPTLAMTPGAGTLTAPYNASFLQSFTASGGVGPFSYGLSGALPSGLSFTGNQISGTATATGSYPVTVIATDTGSTGSGSPFTIAQNYMIDVPAPTITIAPETLPNGTVGTNYSQSATASGGIAAYGYGLTAGVLPPGLALSGGGTISGTPTAGGTYNFTLTATDANGQTGSRSYGVTISAAVVTLPPTSLASGQVGFAYNAMLTPAEGGTAPYSYAVTGGVLPAGINLLANGTLSGTPTAFGSFNFTVTATDASTGSGPYAANQNYTIAIIDLPPVAGPVSVNRAYGSSSAPVPLNLSGGAANSVAIAIAPANGTATVSGLAISYQPDPSFSGTDSFSYTATNAGGISSPATVTATVGAPSLTITAANPLTATVGQTYSQTFSFAGGTGPFGSYDVTGLPAGLSLTGTTGNDVTIGGSPAAQGTFTLTVSGTDASTGSGPFSVSQTFSLAVTGPNLVLAPTGGNFNAAYAAPYSQDITASGGVGPYSYALTGNLPAGVILNQATGVVSGTPTASGSFAFTVTATDTGATGDGAPFTVAGNYSLAVETPTITVTPNVLPTAIAGQNYSAQLNATGAVGPYGYTLTGGALPAGVTLAANGQLSGVSSVSGAFAFTVQVLDANGQTGTANLTLSVGVPALTMTPTTLPSAVQGIGYSQALTAGGGIAPYSFVVTTGALPDGLSLNAATGLINGTPAVAGTTNFAITLSDSTGGTAATLTLNFALQVTSRPDPALDPQVRGLVQAQVAATRRFADAQVDNFMQRMETMHGESEPNANGDGTGFRLRNNIRFSTPDYCRDAITMTTSAVCQNRSRLTGIVPLNNWRAQDSAPTDSISANAGSGSGGPGGPVTIWAGGAIRFGERDAASGRASQDFESEGITIGADYRFSPAFAAGVGIGLGRDTVDVGDEGSRSSGEAKTIAVYASHQFGKGFFVDWLAGYQKLDFDLRRYVTLTGAIVNSTRSGDQWFGTVTAGADIERGDWKLTPYARLDITRATLGGYSESSGSLFDLAFLDQDVNFTAVGAGARFKYRHKTTWGELLPQLRAEYQFNVERSADARVAYIDQIAGPFSNISVTGIGREELTLGGKLEMLFVPDWALALEYVGRFSSGAGTDNMIQVGVKYEF